MPPAPRPRPAPRPAGGGGRRGGGYPVPFPYPVFDGGGTTVVVGAPVPDCIVYDQLGRARAVPCEVLAIGDDDAVPEVDVIDEAGPTPEPRDPGTMIRSGLNLASGRRRPGSTPYYRFGAQARSYPFDWHGFPGGVPASRPAAETRELSGADLYESGLSPYAQGYRPLMHRGLRLPDQAVSGLDGLWSDLSTNERKLIMIGAAAAAGLLAWRWRKKKRRNPARIRRGRRRRSYRGRRRGR